MALASAAPMRRIFSPSALAVSTVFVLQRNYFKKFTVVSNPSKNIAVFVPLKIFVEQLSLVV
jgi:hypothetical protein